jgi:hypothetical protein
MIGHFVLTENRNGHSGGVNPATLVTWRDTLNAMSARFLTEAGDLLSDDFEDDGASVTPVGEDAVQSALAGRQTDVGAHQVLREEAGVSPAFGGADLEAMCHAMISHLE